MAPTDIIAGADGTSSSCAAVQWAAREAARRNVLLRIVHVFDWEAGSARYDSGNDFFDEGGHLAEAVLTVAAAQAMVAAAAVELDTDALVASPAARLLE